MEQANEMEMNVKGGRRKTPGIFRRYWPWLLVLVCVLGLAFGYYIRSLDNSWPERATKLRVDKAVSDHLEDMSDTNWYAVTLPADGYITVQFDHPTLASDDTYWHMYLYYDKKSINYPNSGWLWRIAGDKNTQTEEIGLPAGTFYIRIATNGRDCDTSTYTLRVNFTESDNCETEDNDYIGAADKISINKDYTGCSVTERDWDYFAVTIPKDAYVTLQFDHPILDSDRRYWYMCLYESDGRTPVDGSGWGIYGHSNLLTSEIFLRAGTYYVFIVPSNSYDASTYTLRVNY